MRVGLTAVCAAMVVTTSASAGAVVQVVIRGEVEFNQISAPPLGLMNSGDAVEISFTLDADNFVNGSFPTRGYVIDQDSFTMTAGAASVGLQNPYVGTPYFILRNDDPGVDGFLFGTDPDVGFPNGVGLDQAGLFEDFRANYSVTYGGDTLSSLDILDAQGTYDFDGLQVFSFGVLDGPFDAAGFIFQDMTIMAIPAPGVLFAMVPLAVAGRRRR